MDFATDDYVASQMVNFAYLIGDRETSEAVVVDPAYDIASIVKVLEGDDMRLIGALATHYHPDHVGGDMMGHRIEGITDLLESVDMPVHVQADEVPWVCRATGISETSLKGHASGDVVSAGGVTIELIHTPGHTPGSQCFLVGERLVSGDTLFLNGCGRTDLPGGDPEEMYRSLYERLARVPDTTVLYPGHLYSPEPSESMGAVRKGNYVFRPRSAHEWLAMFAN